MRLRFRYIAGIGLIVPLLFLASATAVEDTSNTDDSTVNQTETVKNPATIQERIEKYRAALKERLTKVAEERLADRCKPAQAVIKKLGERINANVPARVRAYKNLDEHLTTIVLKLKVAGLDTSTLEQQQAVLQEKIAAFNADLTAYKLELSDLQAIDCASDTTGFKAALEAARKSREALAGEITDIKTYVKDTLKPTLVQLRQQLATQNESSDSGTQNEGSQ